MNDNSSRVPASEAMRKRMSRLHQALLTLHKALLDVESANYEKANGPVSRGLLLQLVMNHEQFAWLRAFSMLIVRIDEVMDAKDPRATDEDAELLLEQARALLDPAGLSDESRAKYAAALAQEASVIRAQKEAEDVLSGA